MDKTWMLSRIKSLLQFHHELGISHLPYNRAVDSFLQVDPDVLFLQQEPEDETGDGAAKKDTVQHERVLPESSLSLQDISEEVVSCHACELHRRRLYPVVGKGEARIRLLIIGDWLSAAGDDSLPAGHLFGVQQDQMLDKMLAAINLQPRDVYITNVIKCAISSTVQPQAVHVQSCLSFLRRQIVLLAPEIICTMGMVAARAVLNQSQSLSQSRGRFHEYVTEKGRCIPVLTTYHPTYLLRNKEMKRATWADLQFLAKKMGLKTV